MYKKKLSWIFLAGITLVILLSYLYYTRLRWITYENQTESFTIDYPVTWKHTKSTETDGTTLREQWEFDTGKSAETGRRITYSLTLFIYSPSNESMNKNTSWLQNPVAGLTNQKEMNISGIKVKETIAPTAIWISPIEHHGKMYYLGGYNNETVKKMLSTFRFTE